MVVKRGFSITKRHVIDPSLPKETVNLVEQVIKCLKTAESETIIDPRIAREKIPESLMKYVAEKCLAEYGANRRTELGISIESSRRKPTQDDKILDNQLDSSMLSI
ncbi:hypothetical protein K7X08_011993 [Anisodus acutangulus]|uniref:Uncharacterized protein n=1 Tax=Anisodus acutangulus TaxID=402998 RepID=A0A9Q1QXT2_9SOLA|nr:hypothetical protein K7X08_011993 [Anisodus acutangulus]